MVKSLRIVSIIISTCLLLTYAYINLNYNNSICEYINLEEDHEINKSTFLDKNTFVLNNEEIKQDCLVLCYNSNKQIIHFPEKKEVVKISLLKTPDGILLLETDNSPPYIRSLV